jgi:hypothetical protein
MVLDLPDLGIKMFLIFNFSFFLHGIDLYCNGAKKY